MVNSGGRYGTIRAIRKGKDKNNGTTKTLQA
jgi:hypothetical protein